MLSFCFICVELCGVRGFVGVSDAVFGHKLQINFPNSRGLLIIILLLLLTAIGLSPGGSGYFTCIQNMKLVTNEFKSGGLHEKHVVANCNLGNHLSICF